MIEKIKDFIRDMRNLNIEVLEFNSMTESMLKRFFIKNKNNIDKLLIILKRGEISK